MKRFPIVFLSTLTIWTGLARSQEAAALQDVASVLGRAAAFFQPGDHAGRSLHWRGELVAVRGLDDKLKGSRFELHLEPPGNLKLTVEAAGRTVTLCQDGPLSWIHVPDKNLLIKGDPAVPRFSTRPDSVSPVRLDLLRLPVNRAQLALLPAFVQVSTTPAAAGTTDYTLTLSPAAAALEWAASRPTVTATVADGSSWPQVIRFEDQKRSFTINLSPAVTGPPLPASTWQPNPKVDDRTETVAAAHLEKFLRVTLASLGSRIPTLPPATGERWLVATEGKGRLEDHDGTRVIFLSGSPEEMGHQHGVLLKKEIRRVVDRILYGVGVGSSFDKGRWFFGEIEEAVRRTGPFIDPRHLTEMDAMAGAAGLETEEVRLANFFPELFHCSGFALLGKATGDGKLYHGRILDYLRGAGLEENAVVMVNRPDTGHAWVNIGYAGFTGSVTAMNEKQLSIGEMGGRGEGSWDGKPMAQLVREVMERCATLEEAIEFMRRTPRTCEYYYVIADAKSGKAAGLKATAGIFEVVHPGEAHPELSNPMPDTVLLSAGSRYDELVKRVKAGFGGFDAVKSIGLMTPPVCMTSNIHSVLFAPGSLDFWVANADSQNVASETRYTPYNLRQLLDAAPAPAKPKVP